VLLLLVKFSCLIIPIVIYKQWAFRAKQKYGLTMLPWLLVFIGYPVILWLVQNNMLNRSQSSIFDLSFFVYIWLIEGLLLINVWLEGRQRTMFKYKLTLDNSLFALCAMASLFWALVFNSTEDAINNQPLRIFFDFSLVLSNFNQFIGYWLQFQIIFGLVFMFYYLHHHLLVNKVLDQHGIFHYLWLTTLFLLLYYPIASQLALFLPINSGEHTLLASGNQNPFDYDNARFAFALLVVSLPIILAFQWNQKSRQISELAKENIHTELLLLQQQINPHFLFNTLNNIYALCLTKSAQAPELVQQLADLLRFVVYKGNKDKVTLAEEVEYLQGYLSLQQVRVSNKCQFDIEFSDPLPDVKIAPLLFVILLENAFKHGIEPADQAAWLNVKLYVEGNSLHFVCANSVVDNYRPAPVQPTKRKKDDEYSGGLGLENLRRRLTLLYGNKHQLKISQQQNVYHVHLILECQ
jgi:sensor histidine kinase YesM